MRLWQIVGLGVIAATIVVGLRFLPGTPLTRDELTILLLSDWPAIALVWLSIYGIAVGTLTIGDLLVEVRHARRATAPNSNPAPVAVLASMRRYLARLAIDQYYTTVVLLLGLGLWQIWTKANLSPLLPSTILASPALRACGALILLGSVGALGIGAATPLSKRKVSRFAAKDLELRLLRQIVEMLHSPPQTGQIPLETPQINILIEQAQRPILEAIKDLATALNRLSRKLDQNSGEIKDALRSAIPERTGSVSTELQDAVTALTSAVKAIEQVSSVIGTYPMSEAFRDNPVSSVSLSRLSDELTALLREISID